MKPVCLITGAAGRLGNALCKSLTNDYDIIAGYRKTIPNYPSQLMRPVKTETARGSGETNSGRIYCIQADLSKPEDMRRLVEVSLAKFGHIDVIINSAVDYTRGVKLLELSQSENFATPKLYFNSIVPFLLVSMIYDKCWKDNRPENAQLNRNVVNVSSIAGIKLFTTSEAYYSASKAAMNMLTLHLAAELYPYSVRANAVCPGSFADNTSTTRVVESIRKLMEGKETGVLVSNI